MKPNHFTVAMLFSLMLSSCGAGKFPVSHFRSLSDPALLDGTYKNEGNRLSSIFYLTSDTIDTVNFHFNKERVTLTYQTSAGLQRKHYRGKFQKNYFEIYLQKKISPIPVFFFGWNFERVRLGHARNQELLIQHAQNNFGWILFGTAGNSIQNEYTFSPVTR